MGLPGNPFFLKSACMFFSFAPLWAQDNQKKAKGATGDETAVERG